MLNHRLGLSMALMLFAIGLPAPAPASEALFKERCSKCHSRAATLARSLKGTTPAEIAAALDKFLQTHHVDDVTERRSIAAYLSAVRK